MTGVRILIVEDERLVARDLEHHLGLLGHEVVGVVARGEEAVAKAGELAPDLVFMDIRLKGKMDGVTAARQIRDRHGLAVVYLTAHADDATLQRALEADPCGYVVKPFNDTDLRTAIELALHQHRVRGDLRDRERLHRAVLAQSLDGVLTLNPAGRIAEVNPAASRLLGRPRLELVGRPLEHVLLPPQAQADLGARLSQLLDGDTAAPAGQQLELQVHRGDGTTFPAQLVLTRLPGLGQPTLVGFLRDLTEQHRLQEQLLQSQRMEAVGRLAAGAAHDFTNLLTAVQCHAAGLLHRAAADPTWTASARAILQVSERAATLARRLLALGRAQDLRPQRLELNGILAELEDLARRVCGPAVTLVSDLQPDLWTVHADPAQLELALLNLVLNARDAMPQGGTLRFQTSNVVLSVEDEAGPHLRPGPYVRLCVSDTGRGMDEATRARAFEPFFTTKEPGQGTGLGLATVYGLVKQSGGMIALASEVGQGTTFTIHLPALVEPAASAPLSPKPERLRGSETILVMEPDDDTRNLLRATLSLRGYTVRAARGPHDADALLGSSAADLVITDVLLADNAADVLAHAAQLRPAVKVLFVSACAPEAVARLGVLKGAEDFLAKPFTPNTLAQKVRQVLDRN